MSVPEGTKPRWPLRPAGFALLGVAVAAAATGLVVLVTGDGTDVAGGRGPSATNHSPGSASARPSVSQPARPTPTAPAPPAAPAPVTPPAPTALPAPPPARPAPAAPGQPGQGGSGGPAALPPGYDSDVAGSGKANSRGAVRVYNNSTIRGLATRAANDLTAAGWTVVEVGNYSGGRIWTTTVYYQQGTGQRATAEVIGAEFGMRVEPRFAGIADASPGVILIVTNDYRS